eukprot:NODE_2941_length_723_cov_126.979228_g2077_i0.p3 GENE.NODE_2941_length_723_cov_126.979228_g2077_i0~~NODE_2941_length_723_cov_126.979228_g2077_i0.p3  ORF type:complete len:90 (+),score=11.92 NODE_2941_length_723_cov_126.979228_g2077_i0:188-457(+)
MHQLLTRPAGKPKVVGNDHPMVVAHRAVWDARIALRSLPMEARIGATFIKDDESKAQLNIADRFSDDFYFWVSTNRLFISPKQKRNIRN